MKNYFGFLIFYLILFSCNQKKKEYRTYYNNGQLKEQINLNDQSVYDGDAKGYYKTGELRIKTKYHKGVNTDSVYIYHKNGQIKEKGYVINQNKIGWWKIYDKNGILVEKLYYIPVDEYKMFHGDIQSENCLNKHIFYKKNGQIDTLKSSFYILKKPKKYKRGLNNFLLIFFDNGEFYSYDTCSLINNYLLIAHNNTIDTITTKKDTIAFPIFIDKKQDTLKISFGTQRGCSKIMDSMCDIIRTENFDKIIIDIK